MTSPTAEPASGAGRHAEGRGYGLVLFAAILLFVAGCFNLIYGIAAIARSHVFVNGAHYVFGDLRAWGWITLILAVLQLAARAGVLAGNQLALWFGVAVVGLNAIDQMFFLGAYPFWSLMNAAVLGSSAGVQPGPSPSLASSSTKPSSIIASLRIVSWNLAVGPMHFPRRRAPLHLVPGRLPSPRFPMG